MKFLHCRLSFCQTPGHVQQHEEKKRQLAGWVRESGSGMVRGKQTEVAPLYQGVVNILGSTHWMYRGTTVDLPTPETLSNALTVVEVNRAKRSCPCWWGDATHKPFEISLFHWHQWETSTSSPLTSPPLLPSPVRLFPTVNKHESCRWYEPGVCIVGTMSNIFKIKVPLHKAWLTTGMCCILFLRKKKLRKPQLKKNNYKKKIEMFFSSLCCNVVTKHHGSQLTLKCK